ncbi:Lsr2 family DNA-binding protein [Streptomyces tsukubensis]
MSALDTLIRLCPPPASVPHAFDWDTIEARLSLRLPDDYKQLVTLYGRGEFNDFLTVYLPDGGHEEYALTGPTTARNQDLITRAQLAGPGRWDLPCAVERLVTMGETGNGDYLFWMTDPAAEPDTWRVAVNQAIRPGWYVHDGGLADFLVVALAVPDAPLPVFPRTLPRARPTFTPAPADTGPTVPPTPRTSIRPADIRTWARAHGYDVPDRGRIPVDILQAYEQAHSTDI